MAQGLLFLGKAPQVQSLGVSRGTNERYLAAQGERAGSTQAEGEPGQEWGDGDQPRGGRCPMKVGADGGERGGGGIELPRERWVQRMDGDQPQEGGGRPYPHLTPESAVQKLLCEPRWGSPSFLCAFGAGRGAGRGAVSHFVLCRSVLSPSPGCKPGVKVGCGDSEHPLSGPNERLLQGGSGVRLDRWVPAWWWKASRPHQELLEEGSF